eukprot:884140-Prorocentrum_minimum.AAC.1
MNRSYELTGIPIPNVFLEVGIPHAFHKLKLFSGSKVRPELFPPQFLLVGGLISNREIIRGCGFLRVLQRPTVTLHAGRRWSRWCASRLGQTSIQ